MDWLDAQCLYRTSELGQLTFPLWVIYPEYTVSVRVESERYAMIIKVTPEGFHVSPGCFSRHKTQRHQRTGGIINENDQCTSGASIFKPVMR